MKKLITEKTIAKLKADNIKVFLIDDDTLITPSAKDAARNEGIRFARQEEIEAEPCNTCVSTENEDKTACNAMSYDRQKLVEAVIKVLEEKGLLDEILD